MLAMSITNRIFPLSLTVQLYPAIFILIRREPFCSLFPAQQSPLAEKQFALNQQKISSLMIQTHECNETDCFHHLLSLSFAIDV